MSFSLLRFESATQDHQKLLSELALRSKALWGYDPDFLERCKEDLIVPLHSLEKGFVQMAFFKKKLIGFYSFSTKDKEPDLNFLFLEPEYKGMGFGRALFDRAVEDARSQGWISFLICSDPNASPFYQSMGAIPIGKLESPAQKGRFLPVLRFIIPR